MIKTVNLKHYIYKGITLLKRMAAVVFTLLLRGNVGLVDFICKKYYGAANRCRFKY